MDNRALHENSVLKPGNSSQLGDGLKLFDSPGSSIFDLPVHNDPTPSNEFVAPTRRDTQTRPASAPTLSSNTRKETISMNGEDNSSEYSFIVISGGTGCNSICSAFGDACYVLPVSDDGGSSSEIIRVLGGPSIGMGSLNLRIL